MKNRQLIHLLYASLLAAFVFVATMIIKIPTPTGGYVHIGDGMVLICGFILGPIWGTLAAGIGSMLADLVGYPIYAGATFIIKALAALSAWVIAKLLKTIFEKYAFIAYMIAGIIGEAVMVLGYFVFEATFMKLGLGATVGIPANIVQGVVGVVVGTVLMVVFDKMNLKKILIGK